MNARAVRLTDVDIDNALSNAHLETVFQPVIRFEDQSLLRYEVFVRWDHPGLGNLPPGAFITFFETQGRIGELTRYVLRQSLEQFAAWPGHESTALSLNLSISDVCDESFPAEIKKALKAHKIAPEQLTLECPAFAPEIPVAEQLRHYKRLSKIGCPLSMEVRSRLTDGMKVLDPFPFVEIKTGGPSIIRYARTSRSGPGLSALSELIAFANEREAKVVAVGVEDEDTAHALAGVGFYAGQGKALGRPGELPDIEDMPVPAVDAERTVQHATDDTADEDATEILSIDANNDDQLAEEIDSDPLDLSAAEQDAAEIEKAKKARVAAAKRAALKRIQAARQAAKAEEDKKRARQQAAEERAAAREALNTARQLQERLEANFEGHEPLEFGDEAEFQVEMPATMVDEKEFRVGTDGLGITVTSDFSNGIRLDGYGAAAMPGASARNVQSISNLTSAAPARIETDASATITTLMESLSVDLYPRPVTPEELEEEMILPADALDHAVADSPMLTLEEITQDTPHEEDLIDATIESDAAAETAFDDESEILAVVDEDEVDIPSYFRDEDEEDDAPSRFVKGPLGLSMPPFLARKYRITHFWPRSWKRAMRRWKGDEVVSSYDDRHEPAL